jgi:signal transduction histidine kinase
MAFAFAVGACWFAAATARAAVIPESVGLTVCVVVLDVVVVLLVARFWDIPYAVSVGVAAVVALDWYHIPPTHAVEVPDARNALALVSYLLMASLLGELAARARRRAVVTDSARSELASEQAALRRVATLVARETAAEDVFAVVTEEVGRQLGADLAAMLRYETDGTATVVAAWEWSGHGIDVGAGLNLEGDNVADLVRRTGHSARIDAYDEARGPLATMLRSVGVRASAGSPIIAAGSMWGVMVVSSKSGAPFTDETERRLAQFTDLIATAVANAQARAELMASRVRLVTAADDARRRIERDLHDGVQQRLVSLALGLRLAEEYPPGDPEGGVQLAEIERGLVDAVEALRELSHGIHPAILSEGGLRPALATLARRSPVPVELAVGEIGRLPAPVEVAVYYVASEALTNAAKHAQASVVRVVVETSGATVRLTVSDDGVGGAVRSHGTGLLGLEDRVHALGGRIVVTSPRGVGTTLVAELPTSPGTAVGAPVDGPDGQT